jgi:hypothetical protein
LILDCIAAKLAEGGQGPAQLSNLEANPMESDSWSRIATKIVEDHEIHLFYEFDGVRMSGPAITLGELAGGNPKWLPADQMPALQGRYQGEKIWEKTTAQIGSDLYDHLQDIVAGRRQDLATAWTLTEQAKLLLERADRYEESTPPESRVRKRIVLTLGKSAGKRLTAHRLAPRDLSVALASATLHVFATRKAFAHLVATVTPLNREGSLQALELLEAQVAFARINQLSWRSVRASAEAHSDSFNLNVLAQQLVQGAVVKVPTAERTRCYTYVRFKEPLSPEDSDFFGLYLARHYTTDYLVDPDISGVERVHAFAGVRHTVALEGAATIISPPEASGALPDFLQNFRKNTLPQHYLPIALLAMHEYAFLVDRTSRSVISYEEEQSLDKTLQILSRLRSDSLVFRVCYRFSQVSHITMHNELNRAFRKAFGLDRMLAEFAGDVTEIEAFLRMVDEHNSQTRFYWFSVIGGASLAGFAGLTIFTTIFKLLFGINAVKTKIGDLMQGLIDREMLPEAAALLCGFLIFLFAVWLISRSRPLPHMKVRGDLTMHAMLEQMMTTLTGA